MAVHAIAASSGAAEEAAEAIQLPGATKSGLIRPSAHGPRLEKLIISLALSAPLSETLLPSERAMALLTLQTVDRELTLTAENQRLQADAERSERERVTAANRRQQSEQSEQEENAHLRKELEELHAKLDAIANIERSLSKRKNGTEGSTP